MMEHKINNLDLEPTSYDDNKSKLCNLIKILPIIDLFYNYFICKYILIIPLYFY